MWVSALISPHGTPARIVQAVLRGEMVPVVSPLLLEELTLVLARPRFRHWFSEDDAREFVRQLATRADMQTDGRPTHHTRDPDDNYLVALAQLPGVSGLVSGDDDLLDDVQLRRALAGRLVFSPRRMVDVLGGAIPAQQDRPSL